MWTAVAVTLVLVAPVTACSSSASTRTNDVETIPGTGHAHRGGLEVVNAYIPQPASPDVAAAYFTIRNTGPRSDRLTAVTSDVTRQVMAMTETVSGASGSMTMLGQVIIPAHGSYVFRTGHAHLMLQQPTRTLRQGQTVRLTLTFARTGRLTMTVPVVSLTGPTGTTT